jgi:hypothetical protein
MTTSKANAKATPWAKKYATLLKDVVSAMGGTENVSPMRRGVANVIATLQTELAMLSDRFANGRGASTEDLNLYLRLTAAIESLLENIGIKPAPVQPHANKDNDDYHALYTLIANKIRTRKQEESAGTFREPDGITVVRDERRIALLKQAHALQQQSNAIRDGTEPVMLALAAPITATPEPTDTNVSVDSPKPTPPPPPRRAPEPPPPTPREPTTTEKYLEWSGAGGARPWWGPV